MSQTTTKYGESTSPSLSHEILNMISAFNKTRKMSNVMPLSICRKIPTHQIRFKNKKNTYLDAVNRSLFRAHFFNISIMVRLTRRDTHKSKREKRERKKGNKKKKKGKKREWKLKKFYLATQHHRKKKLVLRT